MKTSLASKQKEISTIKGKLGKHEAAVAELKEAVSECQSVAAEAEAKFYGVIDDIFSAFCMRNKFKNIREYEQSHLVRAEQIAAKRKEFQKEISAQESTLSYKKGRLDDLASKCPCFSENARVCFWSRNFCFFFCLLTLA